MIAEGKKTCPAARKGYLRRRSDTLEESRWAALAQAWLEPGFVLKAVWMAHCEAVRSAAHPHYLGGHQQALRPVP